MDNIAPDPCSFTTDWNRMHDFAFGIVVTQLLSYLGQGRMRKKKVL